MTADTPARRPVDAVCDQYVVDLAAHDPIAATYAGIAGHDHELPDLSPAGWQAGEELTRAAIAAARAATPTDERERVAQEAFLERLGLEQELAEGGFSRSDFSVISSGLHALREAFDLMPTEGEEAWSHIDARLAGIPEALAGYRTTLLDEAGKGRVSAARQYTEVAGQVRNWTGHEGDAGDLFAALVADADVPQTLGAQLRAHAADASAAYADFGRFLTDEMAPRGREKEAVGPEHYALASRYFLGAEVDLAETYAWGWHELKRLEDDMTATAQRIVPGAAAATALDEAVAALDADPSRRDRGQGGVPRLDAAACRPHRGRDGRRALRHPRAGPPDRVLPGTDQRRGHLLHRAVGGLQPTRVGCGGRCPTASPRSRPGGR